MKISPRVQAWADQTRNEALRMCNWRLLRRLAMLITVCMLSGLAAEFVFGRRVIAMIFYGFGGCVSLVLAVYGFSPRFYVSKPPLTRRSETDSAS